MKRQAEDWPDLLQSYLLLAAGRGAVLPTADLRRRLGPQLDLLQALGAAEAGPPLSIVTCSACYEGHTADVEYDPATRRSLIFCADAGRVRVADEDLATVRANVRWLPDRLVHLLNVRPSPPRRTFIEGAAWWLGDTVVGQTEASIALTLGVRSSTEIQKMVAGLRRVPPRTCGFLLTAGEPMLDHIGDLTRYQPVPIEDLVRVEGASVDIDRLRLSAWVRSSSEGQKARRSGQGGRPSKADRVQTLFNERRQRGEPYVSKLAEAKMMYKEWQSRFPDEFAPKISTLRSHLPNTSETG